MSINNYEPKYTATIDLGRTVYGGTLDVTTGLLTVTHGNIASYNGESLPGKWISSIDVYSAGGTPTTGAQVVYELATPQTYQLTPTEVDLLLGDNNVWADTGDMTLTYRPYADLTITDDDVLIDSLEIDRYSCNGEKLEVGTAIAAQVSFTLENGNGQYDSIVFEGTELFVEVGIADWTQSSPTVTYVPCGYFTPDEQPRRLSTISITALDRMTKFDVVVDGTRLTFPTTVAGLVGQVCTLCGVTLAQSISGLVNAGGNVAELPEAQEEITYRNLIQWCAGVMGTNAWFDWNGQLRFSWYENATGYVSTVDNRYSSDLYEDDLTVSGVEYTNDSGIVIVEGTDDYAIDLTGNAIAGPLVATVLPSLNTALNGFTYRPFAAAVINAPYLWPMDIVTFTDKDGNDHTSALTNVAFGLNGTTAMESKGMTYAINKLAQPKGFTREQAQLVNQAMEHVEQDIDESLTQQEIFNRLTDSGAAQGLVLYNGQLYVNASYINTGFLNADRIQGGTLTLGGNNNVNGLLQVLDANGNVITTLNNTGADIVNGSITTYSADQQTRTILSDGLLKLQFYNDDVQPIGWMDALRLVANSTSATIGTFGYTSELKLVGKGRVFISNQEGTVDDAYAKIDLNNSAIHLYTSDGEGVFDVTSIDIGPNSITFAINDDLSAFTFEIVKGQSSNPLSIGNGGTGASTSVDARNNLGTYIYLYASTVANIYNALNKIKNSETVPIRLTSTPVKILTGNGNENNGKVTSAGQGFVTRLGTNDFKFFLNTPNGSVCYAWRCTTLSSSTIVTGDVYMYSGTVI